MGGYLSGPRAAGRTPNTPELLSTAPRRPLKKDGLKRSFKFSGFSTAPREALRAHKEVLLAEDPIRWVTKYEQIEKLIRERMQRGELKPGDKLESEEALAQRLGVHRFTVNKALASLVREGILLRIQGRGTFVNTPVRKPVQGALGVLASQLARDLYADAFYGNILQGIRDESGGDVTLLGNANMDSNRSGPPLKIHVDSAWQERRRGWEESMTGAGLREWAGWFFPLPSRSAEGGTEIMEQVLRMPFSERPTAFFCAGDEVALLMLRRAEDAGFTIPADFSFIGFGDHRPGQLARPALTTLAAVYSELGRWAVRRLMELQAGRDATPRREVIPVKLLKRGSCAPPPKGSALS